ncbi:lysine 2,3-aminomutase [Amycolatopsis anabasis]|uniref:KamA family radical SAM protein n=1 Tax=Amycolatopsis anabasis TaxID=1840409 RepID=UPI0031B5FE2C
MINTMNVEDLWNDPIRRYMAPAFADRDREWPSHPMARRDSLHEADMWTVPGLTHKYPTKVLVELTTTCPQYCGHCTRMDLVGLDVPQVTKRRIEVRTKDRYELILDYLRENRAVRDVVVSGGDVANVPIAQLEDFCLRMFEIPNIRDVRLATKALAALPQHFRQSEVLSGLERIARRAREREVNVAVHTHINHANSVTPLVARAVRALLDLGFRDVRNQAVLLRGVNDSLASLLDLSFTILDRAHVIPYYVYMCDMVPNSEHWRTSLDQAQRLQHDIMGYLPGFATPRLICDPPYLGKRWVHQAHSYDRTRGISYWTKNYRTSLELDDPAALDLRYEFYDPIDTLGEEGQEYWRRYVLEHGD